MDMKELYTGVPNKDILENLAVAVLWILIRSNPYHLARSGSGAAKKIVVN